MKQVFDFYLDCSVHVALAVFSLSWMTLIEYDIPFDAPVLFFIFFASITGYNFVKFFGLAKFHHRRLSIWLKRIQVVSLVSFLLMGYFAYELQAKTLMLLAGFGLVTFLYAIPFLPKKMFVDQQQNLRNISGVKVYVIALVWAGVTVFIPLLNNNHLLEVTVIWAFIQRFILVLALMLPFEIRDMQFDSIKLGTIPQKIGVVNTKIMGVVLAVLFLALEFLLPCSGSIKLITQLLITLLLIASIVMATKEQGKYYSGFWVESIPVFWLLLVLLFR
ncbi:hypothetical protein ACW5R3_04355 [Bizionia sp. KMM 8389]